MKPPTRVARMPPVSSLRRLRLQAWFALAILVLGMLAPSIGVALSQLRGDTGWQDICRSAASPRAQTEVQQQGEALKMLLNGHCAMCHLHSDDLALPPPPTPTVLLLNALDHVMPERFFSAPRTAHAWRAAPARAPPSLV